ncbi:hypothetical protein FRB90_011670 [Tulasnella sp. 427]|nr:hypothetical protein FRB90_011670 [Tulasnella sp. 427]
MLSSLTTLKESIKGTVRQPGEEGFNLSKWAPNATKPSKIIVTPKETEDIAQAIKYASSEGLTIAVRGGGHSTSTASASDNLLVDMREMTKIRVDEANKIAYIQAGARTHDLEVETIKFGLAAVVGIVNPQVSIGGYCLTGGIGYSTGQYGLALDNLVSATVVLASGEIVQTSESKNPDLFWAIRGGGSHVVPHDVLDLRLLITSLYDGVGGPNFGIVAEVGVKLHAQRPDAYVISYIYVPAQLPQVVEALNEWQKVQKDREAVQFLITLGPDGKPYVIINGVCNSSQEEGESTFKRFLDLGPANVTNAQIPYAEVSNLANAFNELPGNKLMVGAHVDTFDLPQVQKSWDTWNELVKKAPFSVFMYEFYPYKTIAKVPVEQTAFAQRHELMTVLCGVIWTDDSFTPSARDELLRLRSVISGSSSKEAQDSLGYVNYADPFSTLNDTDEYAKKLFGPNYARLQEIKKKYDPKMVFNRPIHQKRTEPRAASPSPGMHQSVSDLKASCKGSVCEPGDEGYNNSKWAPNSTKSAKVIVTPEEIEDIVSAVKFARSQGLVIAVRGGGHSSSTSSATDGLLINMWKMTKIRVDQDAQIGYVQAGALMWEVEEETIKYGLGACAGLCSEVSIGGYTLGGGLGHSLGKYGAGCDNLVSATVVLANGDTVQASESENPDLLWGLKGGGSNFGVVAELGLKLHPQRADAYAISYVYPPSQLEAVVVTVKEWRAEQKQHETICLLVSLGADGKPYAIINGVSNSSQKEGEAAFRRFLDLGPVHITNAQVPWQSVCRLADVMNTIPKGKVFVGAHIDNFDAPQVQKSWDAWSEIIESAPFSILMYEFYPDNKVLEAPIQSAAFAQRNPFTTVLCAIMGIDESDDFAPRAWDELLNLKKIVSASSSQAAQESLGYANYGDPFSTRNETDEYARKLFGPNYPRLQEVKKKYDPDMVFNRWFAIRPTV